MFYDELKNQANCMNSKQILSRSVVLANAGRRFYRRSLNVSMERRKGSMEKAKMFQGRVVLRRDNSHERFRSLQEADFPNGWM